MQHKQQQQQQQAQAQILGTHRRSYASSPSRSNLRRNNLPHVQKVEGLALKPDGSHTDYHFYTYTHLRPVSVSTAAAAAAAAAGASASAFFVQHPSSLDFLHPLHQFHSGSEQLLQHAAALPTSVKTEPSDRETLLRTPRMPPVKRSASADAHDTLSPPKQSRPEHPDEFSGIVRKRLAGSSRTGQACDRCKVRKIRCDGLPGGCSPCLNNHSECRTTDRITGRASTRGFVEDMEAKNRHLQDKVKELEDQLMQARNALSLKNPADGHNLTTPNFSYAGASQPPNTPTPNGTQHLAGSVSPFPASFPGTNYLGVSSGNSRLSSIKGTALSILGMEIDIADFQSPDMDEPDSSTFHPDLHNKSYQAFLQSALNVNAKVTNVELPARTDAMRYVDWYFRTINPYLPILHRPSFMVLLYRYYDEPRAVFTTAERVIINMLFAIILFQIAARNWEDPIQQQAMTKRSNMHYHYSIGMFYELSCSHGVQDVQALTMICSHLRNFPKPGASWILTQTTLAVAIELGLHRSATTWAPGVTSNPLDLEMRKRIFWSLLVMDITLSGKLGRPMSFRMEDFDIELPQEVPDEQLSETGIDTSIPGTCQHTIGIHAMRLSLLYMELYSTIYAVRRQPEKYIRTVNSLEAKLQAWKDGLPQEYKRPDLENQDQIHALYVEKWGYEFRLLLRHPSVALTNDEYFNTENMRICVESSRQMLAVVKQLLHLRSLDTTWYSCATYVLAVTTTIFSQYEKRGEMAQADLTALKEEMDSWLQVMAGVGTLLGSGTRLRDAVKGVIDRTVTILDAHKITQSQRFVEHSRSPPAQHPYHFANEGAHNSNGETNYDSNQAPQVHHTTYPVSTQYETYTVPLHAQSPYQPPANPNLVPYTTSEPPLPTVFTNSHPNWHEPGPHNTNQIPYDPTLAWRNYANMTYNSGVADPADALLQLGGVGGRESISNTPHTTSGLQNPMESAVPLVMGHQHMNGQLSGMEHWPNLVLGGMGQQPGDE